MTFYELSGAAHAAAGVLCLLLCLAGAGNLVLSVKQKKHRFLISSSLIFIIGTLALQVVRSAEERVAGNAGQAIADLPAVLCFGALLVTLALATWVSAKNLLWNQTHVTPLSIQESFEKLTEGLCYYRKGGQCILVNGRMHQICEELTGHMLLNGEEFDRFLFGEKESEPTPGHRVFTLRDGTVYSFSRDAITYEEENVCEIIASNVTELYGKTVLLQQENERLRAFQAELRRYNENIQENVRREEILRAKMHIHDEMNRLLLSARNAITSGDGAEKKKVLAEWKSNAILLCKESEGSGENAAEGVWQDLLAMAKSLGIGLGMKGSLGTPAKGALILFVAATREAMINAVKHAGAKELAVCVNQGGGWLCVDYVNPLDAPAEYEREKDEAKESAGKTQVPETGGLRNLRQQILKAGGDMETSKDEKEFTLRIRIPSNA